MSFRSNMTAYIGALMLVVGWGILSVGIPQSSRSLIEALPDMMALLTVILAWRFRRSRLVVASAILVVAHQLVRGPLSTELIQGSGPALAILALALPLNLGVLIMLQDRPVQKPGTLVHLTAVGLQPVLGAWLLNTDIGWMQRWLDLAQTVEASLLAFLIAAVFSALALAINRSGLEAGMLWVLACCALAIHGGYGIIGVSVFIGAAQLTLLLGLVEDSYRLAFHDELTGLPGRRALNDAMASLNGKFALAMVDIDHFKRFNDRYGHEAGDQALKMVADTLVKYSGRGRAFRYGGEEFTIVFHGAASEHAADDLEELRKAIAGRRFTLRSKKRPRKKPEKPKKPRRNPDSVTLTVSIGLARSNARNTNPEEVLRAADKKLYRAKKNGRNRLAT